MNQTRRSSFWANNFFCGPHIPKKVFFRLRLQSGNQLGGKETPAIQLLAAVYAMPLQDPKSGRMRQWIFLLRRKQNRSVEKNTFTNRRAAIKKLFTSMSLATKKMVEVVASLPILSHGQVKQSRNNVTKKRILMLKVRL